MAENKLKQARKLCGLTQAELAEATGLSLALIQKLETGKHSIKSCSYYNIELLATILKTEITDLI